MQGRSKNIEISYSILFAPNNCNIPCCKMELSMLAHGCCVYLQYQQHIFLSIHTCPTYERLLQLKTIQLIHVLFFEVIDTLSCSTLPNIIDSW